MTDAHASPGTLRRDEALIERVAKAIWDGSHDEPWDKAHNFGREIYLQDAWIAVNTISAHAQRAPEPFQARVDPWLMACFGLEIARDILERNHRFLEEALELVQANGCTISEAHQLVDYVYGRDQGEINQEVGGVMVTLAALCLASGVDMHEAAETELARVWTKVEKIRAKHFAKPKFSPLPGYSLTSTVPFLRKLLAWDGIASSQNLGAIKSYSEVKARGRCKSKGWATFDGRGGYWRITDAGRAALSLSPHLPGDAA